MNAFEFGYTLQKQAAGPFKAPVRPKPNLPFDFSHARKHLAKYDPDYNTDMSSRQVWDRTVELGTVQPGAKMTPFQHVMKRQYHGRMPQTPVFAAPGKPGNPQPQPAPQPPPQPAPQNPAQFGQQVAQGMQQPQSAIPGQPLPTSSAPLAPGFIRNDRGEVKPMSPDFIRMTQQSAMRAARQPAAR